MPLASDWPDYTGREGALRLADEIKWFWTQRGGVVETKVRPQFGTNERNCWRVESDLVGGLPRKWVNS